MAESLSCCIDKNLRLHTEQMLEVVAPNIPPRVTGFEFPWVCRPFCECDPPSQLRKRKKTLEFPVQIILAQPPRQVCQGARCPRATRSECHVIVNRCGTDDGRAMGKLEEELAQARRRIQLASAERKPRRPPTDVGEVELLEVRFDHKCDEACDGPSAKSPVQRIRHI